MMGRKPTKLTLEQISQVEALAAYLTQEQIADYFGIGRTTFIAMIDRDPDISEHYKRGKAKAIGSVAQGLLQKARNGDTASAIFYLKTQAGWRETNHVDHTSSDGTMTPKAALDVSKLSTKELGSLVELLDKAQEGE